MEINMRRTQKRLAAINDISGFGRCSITVILPIISALKVQCCVLPTAVLSAHTAYPNYCFDDYTDRMGPYMNHWKELDVEFDGIYTGFLGSVAQISHVIQFIKMFKQHHTKVIIDPVMGDHGKLYPTYTEELSNEMKRLLQYADVLTPNMTEACSLLDITYKDKTPTRAELKDIAARLCAKGPSQIIITGLKDDDNIFNYIYEDGKPDEIIKVKQVGGDRHGTGDVFSSIVAGSLVNGESMPVAVRKASDFICKALEYTIEQGVPKEEGICFEEYLTELR